jgi:hypothetical protein
MRTGLSRFVSLERCIDCKGIPRKRFTSSEKLCKWNPITQAGRPIWKRSWSGMLDTDRASSEGRGERLFRTSNHPARHLVRSHQ